MTRTSRAGRRAARERGSSTAEYGLMVAALAAGLVGVIFAAGAIAKDGMLKPCSSLSSQLGVGGDCGARESSTGPGDPAGADAPSSKDPSTSSLGALTAGL